MSAIIERIEAPSHAETAPVAWRSLSIQGEWMFSTVKPETGVEVQPLSLTAEVQALKAEVERLRKSLRSVHTQCSNVIFNCEQRPANNERHLNSWASVQEFTRSALQGEPVAVSATECQP